MTIDTVDDTPFTGEPFKVDDRWYRCEVDRPGLIRLSWGKSEDWADWDPLDFAIVPEAEVPATILRAAQYEGDTTCP